MNKLLLALVGGCVVSSAFSADFYVDAQLGIDAEGRGASTAPYKTIQAAVDAAAAEDTIILMPGDYTEGERVTTAEIDSKNRVVINKKLTVRSVNGRATRDTTRIIGAWDSNEYSDKPWGMGPEAVRCVWVTSNGSGSRFEGITFLRGSAPYGSNYSTAGSGGGIMFHNQSVGMVIDCAFIECQAWRGGGVYSDKQDNNPIIARTLFKECRGAKFGYALRGGSAYNCVFDGNRRTCSKNGAFIGDTNARGATSYIKRAVNCTFVNNELYGADANVNASGKLDGLFTALADLGAEFGYRSAIEIVTFIAYYLEASGYTKLEGTPKKDCLKSAIDAAVLQKLLPKLHGSLNHLMPVLEAMIGKVSKAIPDQNGDPEIIVSYKLTYEKLKRMQTRLDKNGFTSFAEA